MMFYVFTLGDDSWSELQSVPERAEDRRAVPYAGAGKGWVLKFLGYGFRSPRVNEDDSTTTSYT